MIGRRITPNYVTHHRGQAGILCLDRIGTSTKDPEFPTQILLEHSAARLHRVRRGIHGAIAVDRPIDVWGSCEVEQLRDAGTRQDNHLTRIVGVWSRIPTHWNAETGLVDPA